MNKATTTHYDIAEYLRTPEEGRTAKKSLGLRFQSWQDAAGSLSSVLRPVVTYTEPDTT